MVRAEADDRVLAVQLFGEQLKDALEVGHADTLVDDKALDLVEQRGVGRVYRVRAVHTAGRNNADRRLFLLHDAYLHARGLRAEHHVIRNIEGVLRVARGVVLRDVERFEVIVVELDLRAFRDREAEADEDLLELVEHDVQRVLLADDDFLARQGDVDGLRLELLREGGLSDGLLPLFDDGLNLGAHVVDHLADGRALLGRNVLHALEQGGQLALFAEELDACIVERTRVRGGGKLLPGGLQNALQLFFHVFILLWNVILQLERRFLRVSAYETGFFGTGSRI